MKMTPTTLLTTLKSRLGIYSLTLPFEDPDKEIMDYILMNTLKTFSLYAPYKVTMTFDLAGKDIKVVKSDYMESVIQFPENLFGDRSIVSISDVRPVNKLAGSGYMSTIFDGSADLYQSMMMAQANANLASVAAPPMTFKFIEPSTVIIYNMSTYYGEIIVEFNVEHVDNLSTIPFASMESFLELALLDVKWFLYGAVKLYPEINSAFGNINLRIDDWANAENDRHELIEKWKDVYHLDLNQFYIL